MLLGADYVAQNHRLRAFETNERRMVKISETMDPCFVGRIYAVLLYMQFAYVDESTRRRMNNAATPNPSRFEEGGMDKIGLGANGHERQGGLGRGRANRDGCETGVRGKRENVD